MTVSKNHKKKIKRVNWNGRPTAPKINNFEEKFKLDVS